MNPQPSLAQNLDTQETPIHTADKLANSTGDEARMRVKSSRRCTQQAVSLLYLQLAKSIQQRPVKAMPRKTKEDAELTRIAILKAALACFSSQGVSKTTLAQIATQADVTRGAVYWHFKDKTDVFEQMLAYFFHDVQQSIDNQVQQQNYQPQQRIIEESRLWANMLSQNTELQQLLEIIYFKAEYTAELGPALNTEAKLLQADIDQMQAVIDEGIAQGSFKSGIDSHDFCFSLCAMLNGLTFQWVLLGKNFDLTAMVVKSAETYVSAILSD